MDKIDINGVEMGLQEVYAVAIKAHRKLNMILEILAEIAPEKAEELKKINY